MRKLASSSSTPYTTLSSGVVLHFSSAARAAPSVCIGIGRALQITVLFNRMGSNVRLVRDDGKVSWYVYWMLFTTIAVVVVVVNYYCTNEQRTVGSLLPGESVTIVLQYHHPINQHRRRAHFPFRGDV